MNLLASLNRWHNRNLIARAEVVNLQAAAELMAGPPVVAEDFALDDLDTAPGMTWHPSYISTLQAEFGREINYRLADVLDEWIEETR